MTDDTIQPSDAINSMLRKSFLSELRQSSSFDVFELDLFEWYTRETEEVLSTMYDKEKEFIDQQVAAGQEDINDSGMVAIEYYTKRVRYSHVIYLASVLEVFLERECSRLTHALGPDSVSIKLSEIRGDQWTTKRKFLERYGRFSIPEQAWRDAIAIATVRNILVHDNGDVSDIQDDEKAVWNRCPGLSVGSYEISVEPEFINYGFSKLKKLSQLIAVEVSKVVERSIKPQGL